jgi:hypothetical protein
MLISICPTASADVAKIGASDGIEVRLVTDEADAALGILAKKRAGRAIGEEDWRRLFTSEGYVRLKRREAEMGRPIQDEEFKTFILSDSLAGRSRALDETLRKWSRANVSAAGRKAMAYLPKDARIRATIYPVIKPRENSFVFEVPSNPAIFLYLDPAQSKEKFENTLVHEMHHIGFGSSCPSPRASEQIASMPPATRSVITWLGAFGEGFAMLAAAGGPDIHPHAVSGAEERARWDRDVANFNADLKKVEAFFLDVLEGRLKGDEEIQKAALSFFGEQGPWYTVGWKMATLIEKTYGRKRLIETFCDGRSLPAEFNRAATRFNQEARQPLATWSASLTTRLTAGAPLETAPSSPPAKHP